ncbi:hypothetical protein X975_06710, partial [Stegodyphus mimosarum]
MHIIFCLLLHCAMSLIFHVQLVSGNDFWLNAFWKCFFFPNLFCV